MALTPIFSGRVSEQGVLELNAQERRQRHDWLTSLRGRDVDVIVRKKRVQRSIDQNAYAHAVPFALIGEEWGEEMEATKLLLLGECFGWHETHGQRLPVKPSTSALSVDEFSHFIEWMVQWAAMPGNVCALGFKIPLPGEAVAA